MQEFKEQLKNKDFKNCYLFFGKEKYLIKSSETSLINNILAKSEQDMNLDIIDNESLETIDLLNMVDTYPFFAEKRVIIVRNSNFFNKDIKKTQRDILVPHIKNLPNTCCLVFIEDKVEKSNNLYKAIKKYGKTVEFQPFKENELNTWIRKEARKSGLTITGSAASHLSQNINSNMEQIYNELQKLIAFKGDEKEITIKDINEVCLPSLEMRIFELMRLVAEGKSDKACNIYRNLIDNKESPSKVFYLLTEQFRNILFTELLQREGHNVPSIASLLEVEEFIVKKNIPFTKKFSVETLQKILKLSLETDLNIKQGRIKEEFAIELLIIKLSGKIIN